MPSTTALHAARVNPDQLLVRAIGVRQLTATIFNYTVGSGIFALPATAAMQLGPAAPLAYMLCAAVMMCVVSSFAEAGSRVSATGGPYAYVGAAFGPLIGLIAGALMIVSPLAGTALVTRVFAVSALTLARVPSDGLIYAVVVVTVTTAVAVLNVKGVRSGVRVVETVTIAKLVPLIAFVLIGAAFVRPDNLVWNGLPDSVTLLSTSGLVIFAFTGIESATATSGEVRNPSTTVPRAAFLALLAVCVLYLAVQAVAQGVLGQNLARANITPLADAAALFAGEAGRTLMLAGATLSTLGFLFGSGLADPRFVYALARDGFLPRYLAAIHPSFRTPHRSIIAFLGLVTVLALTGTFERLLVIANVSGLLVYAMVALSAIRLRMRGVRLNEEPYRSPAGVAVHLLTCVAVVAIIWATVSTQDMIALAILLAVTWGTYAIRRSAVKLEGGHDEA